MAEDYSDTGITNVANAASIILDVDIAIVGGGIAGLWTLARLSMLGYDTITTRNFISNNSSNARTLEGMSARSG